MMRTPTASKGQITNISAAEIHALEILAGSSEKESVTPWMQCTRQAPASIPLNPYGHADWQA